MSEKELRIQIAAIRRKKKEITSSKAKAHAFLKKAGIVSSPGKLAKPYR